ncbi:Gfo/Idh/MocA family oxidoreductase [Natronolimnobius sp. AArcel1]|uniref:Gfo/Idh/MocA family protein n=1 Tax=Natronolimnobius sp. AArcel1 TaxID=1679093 RepID=UPI0013E9E99D|nr:Gfo/Idh/MocA family oxidoreductase [Natronolimnobius sp. AArcel1]NGM70636.1 Gfo/Idh/MocA family oxidoreductase [Natronolimnobius sp. AArcel1]
MRLLHAGIIGCGTIARHHAEHLTDLEVSIAGVADIDPDAREEFARAYDVPETFEQYDRMLEELELDFVVVAVPNFLHADCAVAALERDIDVFLEKPLAHTLEDAQRITDVAANSDGRVIVGFVRAFEGWVEDLKARTSDGEFGEVYDVDLEYVRRRGIPRLGSWFTRAEQSGGGVLIDAGVHFLHLALTLLEFPDLESVTAQTGGHFGTKKDYTYIDMWGGEPTDDAVFDVEDHARGLIRTVDGTTIHFHCAWASNTDPRQSIRVQGDHAGVSVDDTSDPVPTVHATDRDALTDTDLTVPESQSFRAQWEYVTAVVRGEREHMQNTASEGLAVQRVVDAIYESADAGREIRLDDRQSS